MKRKTRLNTFRTTRPSNGWTDVVCQHFVDGEPAGEVIVNSFGGTGQGRAEALRYAKMLNDAVDAFHAAERAKPSEQHDPTLPRCEKCGHEHPVTCKEHQRRLAESYERARAEDMGEYE